MNRNLNVHLLPDMAHPHDLAGHTSVVIDVLRASTTITTALFHGAERIVPCLTVEEARQLASQRDGALLGGERGGERLPGFDFGNSPAEYTSDQVAGKQIIFTTTNGTKAMTRCMGAGHILVGSFVNRSAISELLADEQRIDILCAGTSDEFSLDDALAAGAIASHLMLLRSDWQLNDGAELCSRLWSGEFDHQPEEDQLVGLLSKSIGGRNLIRIGMQDDLRLAAQLDQFTIVPELDKSLWEIRAVEP